MDSLKSLNLHLENLLPGIVTLVLIVYLFPSFDDSHLMKNQILKNELMRGGMFISVAYLLGVLLVAFCRILDKFSEWGPRCWALRGLAIEKNQIKGKKIDSINEHYRNSIRAALSSEGTEVKSEILKRRERLHLLRSTLVPAILVVWVFQLELYFKVVLTIVNAIAILCLYAYLEVSIYDEACLSKMKELKQIKSDSPTPHSSEPAKRPGR